MRFKQRPRISIVTPSLNSARFIENTIESVLTQKEVVVEHIVIDGGSTDGTLEILRQYDEHLHWISEPDRGHSHAMNKGINLASGEIISIQNADDTYEPGAFQEAVDYLETHPEVGFVFADCNWINASSRVVDRWCTRSTTRDDLLLDGCTIPHQTAFFRREVFEQVGGFDEQLPWVMDYELLIRCLKQFSALRVEAVWGNLRVWEGAKTSLYQINFWSEILLVLERVFAEDSFDKAFVDEAFRRVHLKYGLNAAWAEDFRTASQQLALACEQGYAYGSLAALAERVVDFCERPSYLRVDVEKAEQLLDRVLQVPHLNSRLAAQLYSIRTFRALKQDNWRAIGVYAPAAMRRSAEARRNRGLWKLWLKSIIRGAGISTNGDR